MTDNYSSSDIAFIVNDAALVAAFKDTPIEQKCWKNQFVTTLHLLVKLSLHLLQDGKSDLRHNNYGRTRTRNSHKLLNGKTCTVDSELGRGGQGIVYLVDYCGGDFALKWYTRDYSDSFYNNLKSNADSGAPSNAFLWPLAVTEKQKVVLATL